MVDPAEVDSAYNVYDEHPLDEPDEWGDLDSFLAAAGGVASRPWVGAREDKGTWL